MKAEMILGGLRDVFRKKRLFFISLIKGGGSFPFIKIYVADFV